MPPKPIPMSDTRSSNARAHSAPAFRNTNQASYIENANTWNQPQFVAPAPRSQPQTTPSSSLMGPPTIIPPYVTGRSDIQAKFDEIYFTSPLPRSISNIYSTLQTQPQASPNSPSTMTLQQQYTPVPQAIPGASQSYHALAQNINPNTRFRSITQAATQTFAAARQLANAPTQTFGGMGPLSAADPGTAAATFQTYTTENGIKVYVGPFANAYAYFGLTPPNMHTAGMEGQSNNTRAGENMRSTDTADPSVSACKEPATPPHSQGRAFSPSPAYSPLLAPALDLQKLASPLKKCVMPEASKAKRKSQQVAKAIETESEPITQVLEVQQEAKPSNESVTPEAAKTYVKGKGKAIQTDTGPEAAVFDLSGIKNIHSRAQPELAAATDTSVTESEMAAAVVTMDEQKQMPENVALDTQLITTSKPESDAEQVEKKIIAVETDKQLQALDHPWQIDLFESDSAKRLRKISRVSEPVTERTTRSRANMRRAKNRSETEPEAPEVERPSSRRLSGRATLTPRPWWIAGSLPVSVAPVRAHSGSVQPPSMNGKRKRSARNEEQDEQATEQDARRSRTSPFTSGTAQSDSMEYPSVNKNAQQEKASIREDQAIQGQIIDVIQVHDAITAANVSKDKSIKSEGEYQYTYDITSSQEYHGPAATTSANDSEAESINEYLNNIIQEHTGQNAAVAAYDSEVGCIRDEEDEHEAHQACDGLDESVTVYGEEEPEIQKFAHENNWGQVIENESQQGDEDDLVDYDDLPQSPQRPNYPRIWLYPPNQACYYAAYYKNDSPEYPYYMRQQARRYDEDDYQSRSPQYNKDGYQPQDNKNEYQLEGSESRDQPQGFDDGSGEYIDLPKNHHFQNGYQEEQEDGKWGDELPPNHRYYLEMQGAIFDSSSSNPFQSPGRGRTVLQGTKRTFTGLSPAGPRETPPPRQPSAFPRKRKRLLWRENGREELIHQDSPRYLPFPPDTLSSPGRGRTLRRGIRNAWASLSPNGPRKTPPPWEPSLSPRPKKRFRYLHRKEGVDERIVLPSSPSSPFYDISVPSGPLSSEYDGMYQPTEREMNNKISYIDLVSDSTGTPRTPPPRVWSLISSGPHSEEYDGFYQPTEREVRNKIPYIDLVSVSSDSDAPRTPPPKVWPKSNVMGKRNLKKRAPLNPLKSSGNGVSKHVDKKGNNVHKRNGNSVSPTGRPSITAEASSPREGESAFGSPQPAVQVASDFMRKYNFRRSRTVEAKKETEEDMPSGNGVSSGSCITSKTKGRKTPQPPNPKSTRVTRSGAVGKIAGGNAAKSCGRK